MKSYRRTLQFSLMIIFATESASIPASERGLCDFRGEPPGKNEYRLTPFVSGLEKPVAFVADPRHAQRFYVLEQKGLVRVIENGALSPNPILNLEHKVPALDSTYDERGLLGIALHPGFATNRRVILNYTTRSPVNTHVCEFTMRENGTIDPASERLILRIDQPSFPNHKGGSLAFGNDGYLYIGTGDGGAFGDPYNHGQNLETLLGKILRIDIDSARPYKIPSDNPFAQRARARPEIWAYGLRNPWKIHLDAPTGELWAADVGQDAFEEVNLIKKGGNYGWPVMEASACYKPNTHCRKENLELPVTEYSHDEGTAIVGAGIYRGQRLPRLSGQYLFGDWETGNIWALELQHQKASRRRLLLKMATPLLSFGRDNRGEIYVLSQSGEIFRLEQNPGQDTPNTFPLSVGTTGCFKNLHPMTPEAGVLPYEVNAEFWSDGADKDRFLRIPAGGKIEFNAATPWKLPVGTVLAKNFYLPAKESPNGRQKILESRFLVYKSDGLKGYTYLWDDNETDGQLLDDSVNRPVTLAPASGPVAFHYYYPTLSCDRCHNAPSGGALGISTGQLMREVQRGGERINQIEWMRKMGLFVASTLPGDISSLSGFPDFYDSNVSLDKRARAYLHVQCSACHNPTTQAGYTPYDMRIDTPLAETHMCNAQQLYGDPILPGARVIKPGDPNLSVLFLRVNTLVPGLRMPQSVSHRMDQKGVELLREWIGGMTDCP